MVENMLYSIILYKEYHYCIMLYYSIKVLTTITYIINIVNIDHIRASGTHCTYRCLPDHPLEPNE
jgi:hypothetical protein